jgi:TPR repeat protein
MSAIDDILLLAESGNYSVAFQKLKNLANANCDPNEYYYLGLFYLNGYGTETDVDAAVYWLTKSAKKGNKDADEVLKVVNEIDKIKTHFSLFKGFG